LSQPIQRSSVSARPSSSDVIGEWGIEGGDRIDGSLPVGRDESTSSSGQSTGYALIAVLV
jgi:hypothetical protein